MKLIFAILGTHLRQKKKEGNGVSEKGKRQQNKNKRGVEGSCDATPHCSDGGGISVAIREQRPEQGAAYVQGERRY
jgi:hypothetical protein